MICDDGDRVCGSLEILAPFLQGQDYSEEFPVVDVVVALGGREGVREVGTWV